MLFIILIPFTLVSNFFSKPVPFSVLVFKYLTRDSSVGIATGYGMDDQGEGWEFESR
jgi:hypothetical protein